MTDFEEKVRYAVLDIETGERKSTSEYFTQKYRQSAVLETSAQNGNIFYFVANENEYEEGGGGSPIDSEQPILGFNIETGQLVYDKVFEDGFIPKRIAIKNQHLIVIGQKRNNVGVSEYFLHCSKGPAFTDWESFKIPLTNNMSYGDASSSFQSGFVMIEDKGETFINYIMAEPKFANASMADLQRNSIFHINCYNLDKKEWLYKNVDCLGGGNAIPQTDKYVYYGATALGDAFTSGLRAFDWRTGKQTWHMARKDFDATRQVTLGAEAKYGNTIISNNVGFMYGIDATNGTLKWKKPGIGNATSRILFHNGVAYSTSLGGFLYGIDVETGERLLKASCPSEGRIAQGRRLDGFTWSIGKHIRADGSTVLICRNYMYAYAFEAVR